MASRKLRKLTIHFFSECVSVCIFLYGALPGDQHTVLYSVCVCVCVTHPSVIKLRGGSGLDREGRAKEKWRRRRRRRINKVHGADG